jgi:hypothetical protein
MAAGNRIRELGRAVATASMAFALPVFEPPTTYRSPTFVSPSAGLRSLDPGAGEAPPRSSLAPPSSARLGDASG